jgi:hypothetical protein
MTVGRWANSEVGEETPRNGRPISIQEGAGSQARHRVRRYASQGLGSLIAATDI